MKFTSMRPGASMIVAVVALVAAVAGTAYARSDDHRQLADQGPRRSEARTCRRQSVGGEAVREQSLVGVDADDARRPDAGGPEDPLAAAQRGVARSRLSRADSPSSTAYTTNQNVYIDTGEDLTDNGMIRDDRAPERRQRRWR